MTKLSHSYSAIKMYDNCPKRYNMQRVTKEVKDIQGEASLYGERVHKQLEDRLNGTQLLPPESVKYEALVEAFSTMDGELLVEQELTLNASLEPTGWWSDDAWLRSKLDVLILNGEDALVADWKTGKRRPDFFQLELFALQTFKHHPQIQRVKSVFVWLKDMQMDHEVYTRDDLPSLWDKLLSKITLIEKSLEHNNWPAKPSGLCPWCPAKNVCEFAN